MPLWWPDDEIVGDKIDQAKKAWEAATSNVQGLISGPNLLAHARETFDRTVDPVFGGLRDSFAIEDRVAQARRTFDDATAGIGDFNSRVTGGLNQRAAEYQAQRPNLPEPIAALAGAAGDAWQTVGTVQKGTRNAVEAMTGFGPQGADVGAQAMGALDVASTPFTAAPRAAADFTKRIGAPEEVQNAATGIYSAVGPGGAVGSIARRGLPALAGTAAGALAGGIAGAVQGQGPSEVFRSAAEGSAMGANFGEMAPDLAKGFQSFASAMPKTLPRNAELASSPVGAAAGFVSGDPDQSLGDRLKRAAAGAILGPLAVGGARRLLDLDGTLASLRQLRITPDEGGQTRLPLTLQERIAALDDSISSKLARYDEITPRLEELQSRRDALAEVADQRIERPSQNDMRAWGFGNLSDADLHEIADRSGVNPWTPGWFDALDPETVRLYKQEAQSRRGPKPLTPKQQLAALNKEERALVREQRALDQQLTEHYNQKITLDDELEQNGVAVPQAESAPTGNEAEWERGVGSITFRPTRPATPEQEATLVEAGWKRIDQGDGATRWQNPRFDPQSAEQSAAQAAPLGPPVQVSSTPRVNDAVAEITSIRHSDLSGAEKRAAIAAVYDRYPDLSAEERAALRAGTPRQRPAMPGATGEPVPAARPPEQGRVQYPEAEGIRPQSEVPVRPEGTPIPPGTRALGEGNLPTGRESQPPLGDTRQAAIPPVRPGGGPVPPAPQPEGVGVLAPRDPSGTPQIGMEGMPPTREGTVYPERFPPQAPDPQGVGVMSTPRSPLEPSVRRGVVDPQAVAAVEPAPAPEGVGIMSAPRSPIEPSVRRGSVDPAAVASVAPAPPPEGIGVMSTPRSPLEPSVRQGQVNPENIPTGAQQTAADPNWNAGQSGQSRPNLIPEGGQPPPKPVGPGGDPQYALTGLEPVETPLMTRKGKALRERMIKERVSSGMTPEAAERSTDETIAHLRATMPRNRLSPDLREPDNVTWVQEQATKINNARYRINLLANPATAVRDIISNSINLPRLYARTAIGAGVESGAETLGWIQRHERATTGSQIRGMNRGFREGGAQAIKEAMDVMLNGGKSVAAETPDASRGKKWLPAEFGYRIRIAADTLVSNLTERMASYSLGYREADRAGLKYGTPEHMKYAEDVTRRVQGRMQNLAVEAAKEGRKVEQGGTAPRTKRTLDLAGRDLNEDDITQLAKEAFGISRRAVFQQSPGTMTQKIGGLRGEGPMSWVVPFFNTTANIAGESLTAHPAIGPIGTLMDVAKATAGKGPYGIERGTAGAGSMLTRTTSSAVLPMSQRIADHSVGALAAVLGGVLTANGILTDLGPKDASVRRKMMDEGWRPGALRTPNGDYVPIASVLGPLAYPLLFGATAYSLHDRGEGSPPAEIMREFVLSQEGQWAQQSGLRDLYELVNATFSPDPDEQSRSFQRIVSNIGGQYIPFGGALRAVTTATDKTVRDPRTVVERWMTGIPGLSAAVPARRTATGSEVERGPGETGLSVLSPFQVVSQQWAPRRYGGSESAATDAEITTAINANRNWERAPDQYARPTDRQRQLAMRFEGNENDVYTERAADERIRRRQRAVQGSDAFGAFRMPGT